MSELTKAIIVLFVGLLNLVLGLLVLLRNPKNVINKSFFAICMSFVAWCLTLYFYEHPYFFSQLIWVQLVYMAAVMYMSSTLFFSFVFPQVTFRKAWVFAKVYVACYILFSVWLMFFTKWWVIDVIVDHHRGLQTILHTQGYITWIAATWVNFLWITINFILKGKLANGYQKQQLSYLWIGYILFGIAVTVSDGIIPLVWHDTSYFYLSAATNLFFSGLVGYIILKHRFLDIRLVLARSITYLIILVVFGFFYSLTPFLISNFISKDLSSLESLIISTLLSLIMAFSFHPLRNYLEKTTDKFFFKVHYDTQDLLHRLSQTMSSTSDLSELTNKILRILCEEMKISKAFFAIPDQKKITFSCTSQPANLKITVDDIKLFQDTKPILDFDEVTDTKIKEIMSDSEIAIAYPLKTNENFIGLLMLGNKKSGDIYSKNDLQIIEISGPEMAVAIQNSQRFDEINRFNSTLQEEVKTATQELQSANQRLKRLDTLKDEFISIASHDLRSPLAITKGFVWMAVNDIGNTSPKATEHLTKALESTERSISLVNDMLDVSRIEAGRIKLTPKKLNLDTLILKVIEESQTTAQYKKIYLNYQPSKGIYIFADEDRIHQVLGNLISNAIKYSSEDGSVEIKVEATNDKIQVAITDHGIGIAKENLKKLFTKFGRVDNTSPNVPVVTGTGLGLYICKNIVELSNGQIDVVSEPKKGSTFTFTIPKG